MMVGLILSFLVYTLFLASCSGLHPHPTPLSTVIPPQDENILAKILAENSVCNSDKLMKNFRFKDVPQFGALCNIPPPESEQVNILLKNNVVPILCMGLYDVFLRLCKEVKNDTQFFKNVFPSTPEKLSNIFSSFSESEKYSNLNQFCSVTVKKHPVADSDDNEWWKVLTIQLMNETSCTSVCRTNEPSKVHPLCSFTIWSDDFIDAHQKNQSESQTNASAGSEQTPGRVVVQTNEEIESFKAAEGKLNAAEEEQTAYFENNVGNEPLANREEENDNIGEDNLPTSPKQPSSEPVKKENPKVKFDTGVASNTGEPSAVQEINKSLPLDTRTEPDVTTAGNNKTGMKHYLKNDSLEGSSKVDVKKQTITKSVEKKEPNPSEPSGNNRGVTTSNVPIGVDKKKVDELAVADQGNLSRDSDFVVEQTPGAEKGIGDEIDDEDDAEDYLPKVPPSKPGQNKKTNTAVNDQGDYNKDLEVSFGQDPFTEAEDSHFFTYFLCMSVLTIMAYLAFHNKNKLLALAVEGRRSRSGRRRPNSSNYSKLDCSLEEAMVSNTTASVTHVLY